MTQISGKSTRKTKEVLQRATPHNLEAEESLLGAMLLSKDAIADAIEICQSTDFYKPSHQYIFDALTSVFAKGDPADSVTIAEELKRKNLLEEVGGVAQLLKLQADTPAIGNAFSYAEIVVEYSLLRRLIKAANDIAEKAYEVPDDVVQVIDWAEALIFDVAQKRQSETMAHIKEVLGNALDDLEALYARSEAVTGIPTGYADLDNLLSGLHASNLVIVGARPGMGKTAFALGVAANVAMKQKVPVLLFSLEMSRKELVQRLLSSEAQIDSTRMRNGKLLERDWEKISHAIGRLADAPIYIDDNPNVNVMDIRAKSRRLKAREGLGLVVVDYLQLMSGRMGAESRQVEVSEISRGLKILARELDVPVLALSQLSRNLEMRADKRPALSDLRESGSLEQDADVVLFIYRDEVYNAESSDRGTAELIVAKHRSGPTGTAHLAFLDSFTKFANMAQG